MRPHHKFTYHRVILAVSGRDCSMLPCMLGVFLQCLRIKWIHNGYLYFFKHHLLLNLLGQVTLFVLGACSLNIMYEYS